MKRLLLTLVLLPVMALAQITVSPSGGAGGSGTVTSVSGDGGGTGLTLTGGPITGTGTLTLGGTLNIANGGTGSPTALGGIQNLTVSGSNIAAASTVDCALADGVFFHITGSGGPITSFGNVAAGKRFGVVFDGTPTITYNATSMILQGGVSRTVAANDLAWLFSLGSGNWRVYFVNADGSFIAAPSSVNLPGSPTTTTQAQNDNSTKIATTAYANTVGSATNPAVAVQAATTANGDTSGFTYANGSSGIGATFTGTVNTAITIDGFTFTALGQRLLVKDDTSGTGGHNGVYYLTQLQTVSLAPVLTRALDYNQPSNINYTGPVPVLNGTANALTSWLLIYQVVNVGTDPIGYVRAFGSATSLSVAGQTGLISFTGLTSTNRVKTVRDAADTILELGGTYTATGLTAGNVTTNANLTGPITSTGNATAIASQTGTGTTFAMSVAPAFTGNPTAPTQASTDNSTRLATTAYTTTAVSNAIAGVNPAVAVQAATTVAGDTSGFTYSNGVGGIGATLTGPTANVAVTIDGFTFTVLGQRLLVKNDTQSPSGAFNGVYYVTTLQAPAIKPVLTRALDYDMPSDINNTGSIPVVNGTVNATTSWLTTSTVNTVGTDPLTYVQFSINPTTIAVTTNPLSQFAATTSAQLAGVLSDETGTGLAVFGTSPTFLTGVTLSSAPLTLSGNISSAAWTTNGLRIKGVAATLTDTTSSGTVATAYTDLLGGNTIAASSATTFTDYFTHYIKDPVQGTNVTLTNKWAVGGDSLKIGTSNQFTISNAGHVTTEGVTSTGATGTGKFVFDTSPSFTTPVIAGGLTASGSGANTFAGSTGTFITSTGANTLSANTTISGTTTITPAARTSGAASYFTLNIPADTGQTTATESIGYQHATATRTWVDGTVALQRENFFAGPTYNKTTTSATFTDACTMSITPPIAGSGVTFTRSHSLAIADATNATTADKGALWVGTTIGSAANAVGIGGGNITAAGTLKGQVVNATQGYVGTTPTGIFNFNQAAQSQVVVSATEYYLTNSNLNMPASYNTAIAAGTTMRWRFALTKTAAGTGTFQILLKKGTAGTTGDTSMVTQTIGTQTAVVDNMECDVTVTFTSATAMYWSIIPRQSASSGTGFGLVYPAAAAQFSGTVGSLTTTTASDKYGISVIFTTGTPTFVVNMMQAQAFGVD